MDIEKGYCQCGCGAKTPIAKKTSTRDKTKKGDPLRFAPGHFGGEGRIDDAILSRFKIDGVYCRLICLSRGLFTIVDESDYRWLSRWKWTAGRSRNGTFYVLRRSNGSADFSQVKMHRAIMEPPSSLCVDHINGNTLDNRRYNLRIATAAQNTQNQRISRNNSSGRKGVSWHKAAGKWFAQIKANGQHFYLGLFDTIEEAHGAYCAAADSLHGEFANHGRNAPPPAPDERVEIVANEIFNAAEDGSRLEKRKPAYALAERIVAKLDAEAK